MFIWKILFCKKIFIFQVFFQIQKGLSIDFFKNVIFILYYQKNKIAYKKKIKKWNYHKSEILGSKKNQKNWHTVLGTPDKSKI